MGRLMKREVEQVKRHREELQRRILELIQDFGNPDGHHSSVAGVIKAVLHAKCVVIDGRSRIAPAAIPPLSA
jgi:hypothetical protein